jgi:2-keto-3-deoxy-L-rhamnonate aldolase RhmA
MNQWIAKQVLDIGVYGIIFPHISTVDEARNAVSACRYPRLANAPRYNPPGIRGDAPTRAARYWGLSQQEYYARADVWPLAPQGEILAVLQIEDTRAIENLPRMLQEVPGIGVILIGEGDLSQELGHPREYEHPVVAGGHRSHSEDLQGPQRALRPPAPGREEHRAPDRERLPVPDAEHTPGLRGARAGAQARRQSLSGAGP